MNAMPTVSVILPLYRVKDYLAEAIASVRAQTFADWECLCLDDGSGNGMAELARELTAGEPAPAAEPRLVENPCAWLLARGTATVAVWTKLWRREALGGLRFEPSLRGSDDALFTYSAFARFGRVTVLDAALYFYRRHPAAVSVHNPPSYLLANLRFVALLPAVLPPLASSIAVLENIDTVATSATAKNRMTYSIKENEVRCAPLLARPSPLLPLI